MELSARAKVGLNLRLRNGHHLEVRDDGKGFMRDLQHTSYAHIGLHGIAERVRLLQGELDIDTGPGRGTRLAVRLPVFHGEEKISA